MNQGIFHVKGTVSAVFTDTSKSSGKAINKIQVMESDERGISHPLVIKIWNVPEGSFKVGQKVDMQVLVRAWKSEKGGYGIDINHFGKK